ncbi:hypothetical protein V6N12_030413 [Hibiscus sabdariffa]|uniref:Uncharacterized protein n=1 Tax=Hibiscus sabdariffa TaxID=183260 RepID=A0ABR2C2N7_9ROSI
MKLSLATISMVNKSKEVEALIVAIFSQGLLVDGGGERKGMEGIVVGIVGIEGKLGNGGRVTFGTVGKLGMVGSGGSEPGFGSAGKAGIVGCGSPIVGKVGMGGNC